MHPLSAVTSLDGRINNITILYSTLAPFSFCLLPLPLSRVQSFTYKKIKQWLSLWTRNLQSHDGDLNHEYGGWYLLLFPSSLPSYFPVSSSRSHDFDSLEIYHLMQTTKIHIWSSHSTPVLLLACSEIMETNSKRQLGLRH